MNEPGTNEGHQLLQKIGANFKTKLFIQKLQRSYPQKSTPPPSDHFASYKAGAAVAIAIVVFVCFDWGRYHASPRGGGSVQSSIPFCTILLFSD